MAINLDAIRRKMAELDGVRKTSSVQLWKPAPGEYVVRCLPWKEATGDLPFVERWFYYIGNTSVLTPKQFGMQDPIDTLIRNLFSTKDKNDRELAKKLMPKMRSYIPVIVRGDEAKGVQVWSLGKMSYQRLLSFFEDEDVGDFLDPETGFDLKVSITQKVGKQYPDTVIDPRRKSTKLSDDPNTMKNLLNSVPNINDLYKLKAPAEIEKILNDWMNSVSTVPAEDTDGTVKNDQDDELDKLKSEIADETPAPVAVQPATQEKAKKSKAKIDIDAAFDELQNDS